MSIPFLSLPAAGRADHKSPPSSGSSGGGGFSGVLNDRRQTAAPRESADPAPARTNPDTAPDATTGQPAGGGLAAADNLDDSVRPVPVSESDQSAASEDDDEALPALALDIASQAAALQQGMLLARQGIERSSTPASGRTQAGSTLPAFPGLRAAAATGMVSGKGEAQLTAAAIIGDARLTGAAGYDTAIAATATGQRIPATQTAATSPGMRTPSASGRLIELDGAFRAVRAMQARLHDATPDLARTNLTTLQETLSTFTNATLAPEQAGTAAPGEPMPGLASLTGALSPGFGLPGTALPHAGMPAAMYGATGQIAAPLHSPQWPAEFGRQFIALAQGVDNQPHTAELRLDPPELGPLRIVINVSDNVAHASFVSAHASVRQAVEQALPQLQQQLSQAGLTLGQANVGEHGQPGQGFEEAARQAGASRPASQARGESDLSPAKAERTARQPAADALVDTFA